MAAPPIVERHLHHFHRRSPIKEAVRVATTANITIATALNNGDTLDGITLATDDRVLVKNQSTGSQNGIYVVGTSPVRAYDQSTDDPAFGFLVYVRAGTTNAGKLFANTNTSTPTIDTTSLTFAEISAGGAASGLGWFNVEDYGAVHDGTTDDTASIQAGIDAVFAAGGGTLYFPRGIYQIDGALQSTGTFNSQLTIPTNSSAPAYTIRFLGEGPINPNPNEPNVTGAVLRSSWNGVISGTPAIISAGTHDSLTFNYVFVEFQHIEIRAPENPKLTAIDLTNALGCRWDELVVTVSWATPFAVPTTWTVPTNANAIGVDMPWGSNDQPYSGGGNLYINGYYTGIRPSEQCSADLIAVSFCARGAEFRGQVGATANLRHACYIARLESFWTVRPLVFSGDERWVNISSLDIEHSLTPFQTVYDIDDASNYGRGFLSWHTTDWTNGPEDNLLVNGATGLSLHGAYAKRWKLNSVVDIPTGTNPSTNPATGRRLYADSATGRLSGRTPAGTVIDYESALATALDDLTDVTITSATTADRLRYDGSVWRNSALIWRPVTTYDPTSGLWVPLVDGDGNAIMAEA